MEQIGLRTKKIIPVRQTSKLDTMHNACVYYTYNVYKSNPEYALGFFFFSFSFLKLYINALGLSLGRVLRRN